MNDTAPRAPEREATASMTLRLSADGTLTVDVAADPPQSMLHELVSEIALSLRRDLASFKAKETP